MPPSQDSVMYIIVKTVCHLSVCLYVHDFIMNIENTTCCRLYLIWLDLFLKTIFYDVVIIQQKRYWCTSVSSLVFYNIKVLKELEHRKLGWKVFILKYDLGKSLSKEMWCKMADTKQFLTTYFKRWKMHVRVIWGKSFFVLGQENDFPSYEWYIGNVLVCAHFL